MSRTRRLQSPIPPTREPRAVERDATFDQFCTDVFIRGVEAGPDLPIIRRFATQFASHGGIDPHDALHDPFRGVSVALSWPAGTMGDLFGIDAIEPDVDSVYLDCIAVETRGIPVTMLATLRGMRRKSRIWPA